MIPHIWTSYHRPADEHAPYLEPPVKTTLDRPTRPDPLEAGTSPTFDLEALADELLAEPVAERSGRSAVNLVRHAGLTVVLTALAEGGILGEHRAPGPAAITCVRGQVTFTTDRGAQELARGSTITFPTGEPHSVRAREDSALLLVIGSKG